MPYRLRVVAAIDWVAPGTGPMEALNAPMLPGGGSSGQTLAALSKTGGYVIVGTGTAGALAAADVTNLTNAMAADIAANLNANIAIPQGWVSGQP